MGKTRKATTTRYQKPETTPVDIARARNYPGPSIRGRKWWRDLAVTVREGAT